MVLYQKLLEKTNEEVCTDRWTRSNVDAQYRMRLYRSKHTRLRCGLDNSHRCCPNNSQHLRVRKPVTENKTIAICNLQRKHMAIVNCIPEIDSQCVPDIPAVLQNSGERRIWIQIRFCTKVDDKIKEELGWATWYLKY